METRGQGLIQPIELVETMKRLDFIDADTPEVRLSRRRWQVRHGDTPMGRLIWEQGFRVSQVNWGALFSSLRARVPNDCYRSGADVAAVEQDANGVTVTLGGGDSLEFELLLAADGNMSTVRRLLFPEAERRHSGYVVWRGWFDEELGLLQDARPFEEMNTFGFDGGHANFWLLPSAAGAEPGRREVAWNIYGGGVPPDLTFEDGVIRSVPPGRCTLAQLEHLRQLAERHFPPFAAHVVEVTDKPIITPIDDVRVPTLARGRVALLGDAAIVLRPMTGSGATKGLQDAVALSSALASTGSVAAALERYTRERWPVADHLVRLGQRMGRALVTEAPPWSELTAQELETWLAAMLDERGWYAVADADP